MPRKSTGPNFWARENPEAVAKLVELNKQRQGELKRKKEKASTGAAGSSTGTPDAGTSTTDGTEESSEREEKRKRNDLTARNMTVTSAFNSLPLEQRNEWENKAILEAERAKAEYDRIVKDSLSEKSKDRQL